jgi:hypothetical protein
LRPDLATDGLLAVETAGGQLVCGMTHGRAPGAEPMLSVRTVHLPLFSERPDAARNVWPVRISSL